MFRSLPHFFFLSLATLLLLGHSFFPHRHHTELVNAPGGLTEQLRAEYPQEGNDLLARLLGQDPGADHLEHFQPTPQEMNWAGASLAFLAFHLCHELLQLQPQSKAPLCFASPGAPRRVPDPGFVTAFSLRGPPRLNA